MANVLFVSAQNAAGKNPDETRRIRDEISRRVTSLIDELAIAA